MLKWILGGVMALCLLVVLLLVGGWWFIPQWLPSIALALAQNWQVEIRSLTVGRPVLGGWQIEQAGLRLADGTVIQADQVVMRWDCCDALGHVALVPEQWFPVLMQSMKIQVGALVVTPAPVSSPASSDGVTAAVAAVSVKEQLEHLHAALPPLALQLDAFEYHHPQHTLAGDLSVIHDPLGLRVSTRARWGTVPFTAELSWTPEHQLDIALQQEEHKLGLIARAQADRWLASLNYTAEVPELLNTLEVPLRLPDGIPAIKRLHIEGQGQLNVPDVPGAAPWELSLMPQLDVLTEAPALNLKTSPRIVVGGMLLPEVVKVEPFEMSVLSHSWPAPLADILPEKVDLALQSPMECSLVAGKPECSHQTSVHITARAKNKSRRLQQGSLAAQLAWEIEKSTASLQLKGDFTLADPSLPRTLGANTAVSMSWAKGLEVQSTGKSLFSWTGLNLPEVSSPKGELSLSNLKFALPDLSQAEHWQLQLSSVSQLQLQAQGLETDLSVNAQLYASDQSVKVKKGRLAAMGLELPFSLQTNLRGDAGSLDYQLAGVLNRSDVLTHFIPPADVPVRVIPGPVNIQGNLAWRKPTAKAKMDFRMTAQGHLSDWYLSQEPHSLNRLSADFDVALDPRQVHLNAPLTLKVAEVASVVPAQQASIALTGDVSLAPELRCDLTLTAASVEVFSGQVRLAHPSVIDCPLTQGHFWVEVLGLDLAQLVSIEHEHINASGKITGLLPLTYDHARVYVAGGQVGAEDAGWIRLRDAREWKTLAGSNEQMMFAVSALENFNYNALTSRVDFTPEGLLQLAISMQGSNPNVNHGQQIIYNLNVESNILSLLKSMEMADDISRRLQKNFR